MSHLGDDEIPFEPDDGELHQLVRPGGDIGEDDEADEIAVDAGRSGQTTLGGVLLGDDGEVSAEEAAMHLTDEPPMGDGDGYVDD